MSERIESEPATDSGSRALVTRRRLLIGGGAVVGVAAAGAIAWPLLPPRIHDLFTTSPPPYIPDAPKGKVTLESVHSEARGMDVDFFTAVPAGYGDGKGLPVVIVCHGATGEPSMYEDFGFPQFVTASAQQGNRPFVLAGAYGSALRWEPQPDGDDPRSMVFNEIPQWLDERGFDSSRLALWGWSMGGYGILRMAEIDPSFARAAAAFSPAISDGDEVFANVDALGDLPIGLWCGTEDSFYDAVRHLADALPTPPEIASFSKGAHTRVYWNDQTLDAFAFLASHLGKPQTT